MSTTTQNHVSTDSIKAVAGYRTVFDAVQRWLALLGVVLCALQIGFAALGFWGGQLNGGSEQATRAAFEPHGMNGEVLQYLAVLLLILGLVARSGWKGWVIPLVLAVMLFTVQGILVGLGFEVNEWFGFLHAISGTVITAGFVWLMVDRWRHPLKRA